MNLMDESMKAFLVAAVAAMAEYLVEPSVQPPTANSTFSRGLRLFKLMNLCRASVRYQTQHEYRNNNMKKATYLSRFFDVLTRISLEKNITPAKKYIMINLKLVFNSPFWILFSS